MNKIRIIARDSRLSLLQVQEAMGHFPEVDYQLEALPSYGDKHKAISLLKGEAPANMFTRELDEALLTGRADIAIHSAKDLPYPLPKGLEVIALFAPFDPSDSLVSRNHLPLQALPAGSKVGTSSPMRKRELQALRPDLQVVGIRGCIEERVAQVRNGQVDAAIVATCALKRLGMEQEISEVLPFETHPLQGYLAITAKEGNKELAELFAREDVLRKQGMVTLVGFGPGDPELLTIKGERALRAAAIIFYDDLTNQDYLNKLVAEKVYVGKRSGQHHAEQHTINRLLLQAAREGKQVVRLKGGDPMLFAHGGEEIEYLQSNLVKVSVIPGVTTVSALAASTKVSLTHRGISSSVALVNGHAQTPITPNADTLVYYMGGKRLDTIGKALLEEGWAANTPVLLVHNVSKPDEQVFETILGNLHADYPTPLITLVGDVAALRHQQASSIKRTLYTGAICTHPDYIHTPLIAIEPCEWTQPSGSFDYLLFTSRHAVQQWFSKAKAIDAQVVSIGSTTTKALQEVGVEKILQVEQDDSYGVLDFFRSLAQKASTPQDRSGKGRVLLPRSDKALPIIPEGLRELGFEVKTVTVYHTTLPTNPKRVHLQNIQRVVFTSPSTIDNFIQLYGSLPPTIEYVTRGRTTENHLKSRQNEKI